MLTKRETDVMQAAFDKAVTDCAIKAQMLMVVAVSEALGIGEKRWEKVFELYPALLDEYKGLIADDVADELLAKRVKLIMPSYDFEIHGGKVPWEKG